MIRRGSRARPCCGCERGCKRRGQGMRFRSPGMFHRGYFLPDIRRNLPVILIHRGQHIHNRNQYFFI